VLGREPRSELATNESPGQCFSITGEHDSYMTSSTLKFLWQIYEALVAVEAHRADLTTHTLSMSSSGSTGHLGDSNRTLLEVYYESIKREPKIRGINKCRCDERLQTKTKEFTRLPYTGLVLELEHLKIQTRLISERFENAIGECEN
jgi:hypothetical protein